MKKMYLIFLQMCLIVIFILPFTLKCQVVNGGFETLINAYSDPYVPTNLVTIERANGWKNLFNSCDVYHTDLPAVYPETPHTDDGCGRFGFPESTDNQEYFFGRIENMISGTIYVVSFWVKKDSPPSQLLQMGAYISSTQPTVPTNPYLVSNAVVVNYIQTHIPQITHVATSDEYEKVSFCYTPSVSGTHFITFGTFSTNNTTGDNQIFLIDDVEVLEATTNQLNLESNITIPSTIVCLNNDVIVDGSSSLNEIEYSWDIYYLQAGNEILLYHGANQSGEASTFNVTWALNLSGHSPQPGDCYRVYLTGYNGCNDVESIDFCYEDPNINFLNGTNYLCEGVPTDLTVTGDNGWTYTWSTGESGLGSDGFKTIQVTPTGTTATYSVNVVTTLGCSVTESITFNVFSSNNLAPWMNGINGSGEYTIYVNQGDIVNFNSNLFNDNTNELVTTFIGANNLPSIFWQILEPTDINGQTLSFQWNTGQGIIPDVSPGIYQFTLVSNDGNQCSNIGPSYFTFTIVVICDQCPMCVYYEDRGLMPQTPLPSETKAGKCIVAGFSQPVSTGGASVLFQAGVSIDLGTFFTAEPGFVAQIDPTTCVMDCEDCCTDWTGFTMDEIPNGYYMNFDDSDPTNDIFQVTDINHPFCAFSAKGYGLSILNQWGNVMAESAFGTSSCCPFESPAPENPVLHSSIWWDGYTENIFGNQVHPHDGTYFYILTLYGCNGEEEVYQGFSYILSSAGKIASPSDNTKMTSEQIASIESINRLMEEISLAPNPASSEIQIIGIEQGKKYKVQLFDDKGIMLEKDLLLKNGQFDVSKLNPGTYFCKIFIDGTLISKKFVKI